MFWPLLIRALLTSRGKLPLAGGLVLLACTGCGFWANNRNADGVRYFSRGQLPAAQARFEAAKRSNPQNADAYYNLAAVAHMQGLKSRDSNQLTQAESLYNQCLDLNPNHVDCHRSLAVLLAQTGRVDRAFALQKNWCATSPNLAEARVELARLYEEYGDLRTAELQLQQALQLDLNNARAHAALGSVKEKSGDLQQALANYQRSYHLNTRQDDLPARIASLQQRVGSVAPASTTQPTGTAPLRSATGFQPKRTY